MTDPPNRIELTWKYGEKKEIINPKINGEKCSVKRAKEMIHSFSRAL